MLIKEKIPIFESFVNFKLSLNNKKYTKTEANSKSEHLITKKIMVYLSDLYSFSIYNNDNSKYLIIAILFPK